MYNTLSRSLLIQPQTHKKGKAVSCFCFPCFSCFMPSSISIGAKERRKLLPRGSSD